MIGQEYVAWVPTISGRLSFSIIGNTSWPRRCLSAVDFDGGHCGFYFQERFCDDFTFPFLGGSDRIRNFIFGVAGLLTGKGWRSGRHFFICTARHISRPSERLDGLEGTIYPVLSTKIGKDVKRDICRDLKKLWMPLGQARVI